jgi:hypothetical protein
MNRAAKLGAMLLVFLMAGAPLVACMLPVSTMSDDEQACCREMAGQCGQADMPSSHSCCKTLAGAVQVAVAKSRFELSCQSMVFDLPQPHHDGQVSAQVVAVTPVFLDQSPPETPPSSSNILRI